MTEAAKRGGAARVGGAVALDRSSAAATGTFTSPQPSASWINQLERFFGLLTERQIRRGVHRSTAEIEVAIHAYLEAHNANPKPFRWGKAADDITATVDRFCSRTLQTTATLRRTSDLGQKSSGWPIGGQANEAVILQSDLSAVGVIIS